MPLLSLSRYLRAFLIFVGLVVSLQAAAQTAAPGAASAAPREDYLLGSGPMFIGHGHPAVTEAVLGQVPKGTTFFANNAHGIRLAEAIVEAVPCAEQVRFVSTGSEADLYAMRLARAVRGRPTWR